MRGVRDHVPLITSCWHHCEPYKPELKWFDSYMETMKSTVGSFVILAIILGISETVSNHKQDKIEKMLWDAAPANSPWRGGEPDNFLLSCATPSPFCLISPRSE